MKKNRQNDIENAQVMLEFTFSMVIVMLLIFATVRIFQWSGLGLAERRMAHERILTMAIIENYNALNNQRPLRPLSQIDPYFYNEERVKPSWGESL